jgi:hypothetical protein
VSLAPVTHEDCRFILPKKCRKELLSRTRIELAAETHKVREASHAYRCFESIRLGHESICAVLAEAVSDQSETLFIGYAESDCLVN